MQYAIVTMLGKCSLPVIVYERETPLTLKEENRMKAKITVILGVT
jgi:hypothetical protein